MNSESHAGLHPVNGRRSSTSPDLAGSFSPYRSRVDQDGQVSWSLVLLRSEGCQRLSSGDQRDRILAILQTAIRVADQDDYENTEGFSYRRQ